MNLTNVRHLLTYSETGTWYRALPLRFLPSALATAHTKTVRSRFNAGPLLPGPDQFEIFYLAGSHSVALYECGAMFGVPWSPEGFFAISAKVPTDRNLVVLPENLDPQSFVEFRDPAGALLHRIP